MHTHTHIHTRVRAGDVEHVRKRARGPDKQWLAACFTGGEESRNGGPTDGRAGFEGALLLTLLLRLKLGLFLLSSSWACYPHAGLLVGLS